MKVAVFCASSNQIGSIFFEEARKLGEYIGALGWHLIYGGTNIGLMQEVACATLKKGSGVTGIIPECIQKRGVAAEGITHLIVAQDMKERKYLLREKADAFIALPGGWGTLEEITEVITLKQLGEHNKPIVFLNTAGFYDTFISFIESIRLQGFVSASYEHLYRVVNSVPEAIEYIQNYQEEDIQKKY